MKAKIIEIEEIGFPKSLIYRENAPISELIDTEELVVELFEEVKKLNEPAVINNEGLASSEGVAVCFNYKCPFDMNNEGVCAYGSTKCTAKQTDL